MIINIKDIAITKVQISYENMTEAKTLEGLYLTLLEKIFIDKPALVLEIGSEKKYSITYDLGPVSEFKIGRTNYNISMLDACTRSLLESINDADEFSRGLLILLTGQNIKAVDKEEIVKYVHYKLGLENLPYETVFCENDGLSLCFYNCTLPHTDLNEIVEKYK
jgi:hypothetical protein